MRTPVFYVLFALGISLHTQVESKLFIPADDPNYIYTGRFDFSDKKQPVFMYSGCAIRTVFEGSSVELFMKDDSLRNIFTVIIDDSLFVLKTDSKQGRYLLADDLENKKHNLEIIRRTEWHGGNTVFVGLYLDKAGKLFMPEARSRKTEFIGDSYTCGYGNEGKSRQEDFRYETENNYMTYGAISARTMNAEYLTVCRSGIGMYQGYGGGKDFNMPKLYDEVILNKGITWDYSVYQPQLVVIDLGGNDLSAALDSDKFIRAYLGFLARVRKNYPFAKIVCIAGPSSEGNDWQEWRSLIHTVVNQAKNSDDAIYYFEFSTFEPNGSDWHPNVEEHIRMAEELTPFLEVLMDW